MTTKTNLDFVSVQVQNLEESKKFYTETLGFTQAEKQPNPQAIVFGDENGAIFAIRTRIGDSDWKMPGKGMAIWFAIDDIKTLYKRIKISEAKVVQDPAPSPFGTTIVVQDPDGYLLTFHELA